MTPTPDRIRLEDGECIASATTNDGYRPRWTVFSVWYLHNPDFGGKRWVARVEGHSTVTDERTKVQELRAGTLERAVKLIQAAGAGFGPMTTMAAQVEETAREWADDNRVTIENDRGARISFASDEEARRWLFRGVEDAGDVLTLRDLAPFIDRRAFCLGMGLEVPARG